MKDDQIAVKMLTRFKQIKKNTSKKMADVEMMLGLLDVVREYDVQPLNKVVEHGQAVCRHIKDCQLPDQTLCGKGCCDYTPAT